MVCVLKSLHLFVGKNFFFSRGISASQCRAGEVTSEITKHQTNNKSSTKQLTQKIMDGRRWGRLHRGGRT